MKKHEARKCELCGVGERVPFAYTTKRELDGRTYSGEVPATRCNKCGEELVGGPGLVLFDDALTATLAKSGNVGPRGFRWLRGRAQLEAKRLAELLDVTAGSVSRWEHGKQALDRRAVALVSALALDALDGAGRTRGILEALAAGKKGPRRVKIDVGEVSRAK
jgi:DNA-binding transcriptional regulator YiaG